MADETLRIKIQADAAKAEADLREISNYAETLSGDDVTLIVNVRKEAAEADLKALRRKLAEVSSEADVKVVLEGIERAEQQIKSLAATARNVDVSPSVRLEGLKSSLSEMSDSLGGMGGNALSLATNLGSKAGVAGAAAAAAVATYQVAQNTADAAIDAKALSVAVGGTTEETSRLLAATKQVGLDYNDLQELIAESSQKMALNADEAQRLGVNMAGTPVQKFVQLADAIYRIPDDFERSQASLRFFGEEGSKQMGRLIGTTGSLQAALDAVSDSAIVSEEEAANAAEFNRNIGALKSTLGGLATEIGNAVIPAIADMAGGIADAYEFVDKLVGIIPKVDGLGDVVGKVAGGVADMISPMDNVSGAIDGVTGALDSSKSAGDRTKDGLRALTSAAGVAVPGIDSLGDALFNTGKKAEESAPDYEMAAAAITGPLGEAWRGMVSQSETVIEQYGKVRAEIDELKEANQALRDELLSQAEAQLEAARGATDFTAAIEEAKKEGGVTRDEYESLNDTMMRNAELSVKAAGLTMDSTEGAKAYSKSLLSQAAAMGGTLNPEIVDYLHNLGLIPDDVYTEIIGLLADGKITEAEQRLGVLDAETATPEINASLDRTNFAAATREADALDGRKVTVEVEANVAWAAEQLRKIQNMANNLMGGGARQQQSSAARYVWRNGRYVEV